MCCIYFLQTAGLQCGQRDREGHRSTHTLAPILTRICVCVCQCTSWLLSCACLRPRLLWWRTPGHIFPSHLPRHRLCVPRLAVLTGGVATVMDDCALSFSVRVLHLCYLPCGSLSKTSCRVSYTLSPPSSLSIPLSFSISSSSSSSSTSLISTLFSSLVGPAQKLEQGVKIIPEIGCQPDNF